MKGATHDIQERYTHLSPGVNAPGRWFLPMLRIVAWICGSYTLGLGQEGTQSKALPPIQQPKGTFAAGRYQAVTQRGDTLMLFFQRRDSLLDGYLYHPRRQESYRRLEGLQESPTRLILREVTLGFAAAPAVLELTRPADTLLTGHWTPAEGHQPREPIRFRPAPLPYQIQATRYLAHMPHKRLPWSGDLLIPRLVYRQDTGQGDPLSTLFEAEPRKLRAHRGDHAHRVAAWERIGAYPIDTDRHSYHLRFRVTWASPQLLSLVLYREIFPHAGISFGEAGRMPTSETLLLDLRTGRAQQLADLFLPGFDFLQFISAYAQQDLKEQLGPHADQDWIQQGTRAHPRNYTRFFITPDALVLKFGPRQVASQRIGMPEVVIPARFIRSWTRPGPVRDLWQEK